VVPDPIAHLSRGRCAADLPARHDPAPLWLVRPARMLPTGDDWLTGAERRTAAGLRFPKRRGEFLLRRLAGKHAVAAVTGRGTDPTALATIGIANAPDGAPYVTLDGRPAALGLSLSDRSGWALCVLGDRIGCDLELVERRSAGFVTDFLTAAEASFVAASGMDAAVTANVVWSAKESALKVCRAGLRRDTRELDVTVGAPGHDGWGALWVEDREGGGYPGWWRRDGRFVLTVAARMPIGRPAALDPGVTLAGAEPGGWSPAGG